MKTKYFKILDKNVSERLDQRKLKQIEKDFENAFLQKAVEPTSTFMTKQNWEKRHDH